MIDAALVAPAGKVGGEECGDARLCHVAADEPSAERENIGESLQKSTKVKSMYYYLPPNPVQDARNATGGGYHSDGRILVVMLQ